MHKTECISSSTQGLAVEAQGGTAGLASELDHNQIYTTDNMNKETT
jgi:hypothetical protein